MWCDRDSFFFCSTPLRSAGYDCAPIGSSWNLQRGLLEFGCSRPFKLWLKLQRTNNKSDTVRSRLVRPEADALKWAVRFSSGGIRWREKTRQWEVQSLNSQPGLAPEAAKVGLIPEPAFKMQFMCARWKTNKQYWRTATKLNVHGLKTQMM